MQVQKRDLERVLELLNEAKKLHEGGYHEAHEIAEKARLLLLDLMGEAHAAKR